MCVESSSYIVNIMYTTLFLVVLFERAVAVEFSVETQKEEASLNYSTLQKHQIFHIPIKRQINKHYKKDKDNLLLHQQH